MYSGNPIVKKMHERNILDIPLNPEAETDEKTLNSLICDDCGGKAKRLIIELDRDVAHPRDPNGTPCYKLSWFHCGICDVGV